MLKRFVPDPITLRAAQAVGAAIFALIVAYLARRAGIRLLSHQKAINRLLDTQNLCRPPDVVCHELCASRQCPTGR